MFKKIVETVTGSFEDKRKYREYKRRINCLPKEYKEAMLGIQTYMWNFSLDATQELYGILEMFEVGVEDGRKVTEIIGGDIGSFCDDIINESPEKTWIDGYKKRIKKRIEKNIK